MCRNDFMCIRDTKVSPPEDYFPLRWISYGHNPPHLKSFFFGGGFKNLSAGFLFCSHLPIVFNRESTQGHGPIIAEPCLPYFFE